jgi:hypothetical protein
MWQTGIEVRRDISAVVLRKKARQEKNRRVASRLFVLSRLPIVYSFGCVLGTAAAIDKPQSAHRNVKFERRKAAAKISATSLPAANVGQRPITLFLSQHEAAR